MNFRQIEMTESFCRECTMAGVWNRAAFDVLARAQKAGWVEGDDLRIAGRIVDGRFIPDDFGAWLMRTSTGDGSHLFRPVSRTVH